MFGLTTDFVQLSIILEPLSYQLNSCWWYLGGAGACLEQAEYSTYELLTEQTSNYRVGIPGWFRHSIDKVDTNWSVYFACESPSSDTPRASLDLIEELLSRGTDWFGDAGKWPLPQEVLFICRDLDCAYWDLFFREEYQLKAVENHLRRFPHIRCSKFTAQKVD